MQPVQTDVFVNTEAHLHAVRQQHGTPENVKVALFFSGLRLQHLRFREGGSALTEVCLKIKYTIMFELQLLVLAHSTSGCTFSCLYHCNL